MNKELSNDSNSAISIRHEFHSGDIGCIIYLHGTLYAQEQGWNYTLEAYVAGLLSEFAKSHSSLERIWIVEKDKKIIGSIAIVKFSESEAQLRWLLLEPKFRGMGLGRRLVEEAVAFCKASGYSSVFLWTVSGLFVAEKLYRSIGFKRTQDMTHEMWGSVITEVRYDLVLPANVLNR